MELTASAMDGVLTAAPLAAAGAPLRDQWYLAALSREVKAGKLFKKTLLGEPVVLARDSAGAVFALRDVCPHRGVPLSGGRLRGGEVQCPYHGWRFRADGACTLIPSLVEGQGIKPEGIKVRRYRTHERNGLIWIYMSAQATGDSELAVPPPDPGLAEGDTPRLIERQIFPVSIDHAVVGLMDPAHGPFVHNIWFWRNEASIHSKAKAYGPSPFGFVMKRHAPSKNAGLYKPLGGKPTTEIAFTLPSLRYEDIRTGKYRVFGLTACTPLDDGTTEVTQAVYWNLRWLGLVKPVLQLIARTFLGQDRRIVTLQREGLKHNPRLMLIQDADTPAIWYFRLKKEWAAARSEGRNFVNPVPETTLRWRS